jgi:hypothetical protein
MVGHGRARESNRPNESPRAERLLPCAITRDMLQYVGRESFSSLSLLTISYPVLYTFTFTDLLYDLPLAIFSIGSAEKPAHNHVSTLFARQLRSSIVSFMFYKDIREGTQAPLPIQPLPILQSKCEQFYPRYASPCGCE